ncbi:MAG: hypothetical protein HC902_05895 [Calothrix sp. SM1_5_4]|nr:hypothetical protein [Calothrix sp. SM1_5_4]
MSSRLKLRHALAVAGVGIVLSFQNCAQPPEDSGLYSASSYQSKLPLAYDAKVDTISYMSCSGITADVEKRAYFSFRTGAYNPLTGGISITDEFRAATKYYSPTERAKVLSVSDKNANTRLNLSVRLRSNLQSIWAQNELRLGEEIESFLPPLSSSEIAGPLGAVSQGSYINYFPGAQNQRLMEASLRFYQFENVAADTPQSPGVQRQRRECLPRGRFFE